MFIRNREKRDNYKFNTLSDHCSQSSDDGSYIRKDEISHQMKLYSNFTNVVTFRFTMRDVFLHGLISQVVPKPLS